MATGCGSRVFRCDLGEDSDSDNPDSGEHGGAVAAGQGHSSCSTPSAENNVQVLLVVGEAAATATAKEGHEVGVEAGKEMEGEVSVSDGHSYNVGNAGANDNSQ